MDTNDELRVKKLRWRCRRGMKELDVILTRFLDEKYPTLDEPTKLDFVAFLEESDMDLLNWCTGRSVPSNGTYDTLLHALRLHGQHA